MGFAAENLLRDGKLKDAFDDASVKNYLKEVRLFLAKMMLKIFERSPLNSNFVRYVRIFDPKVMASYSKATNEGCMKGTVRCLIEHKYITPSFGDSVLVSFGKFQGDLLVNKDKFLAYDRNKTRLDDFYFNGDIDMRKYPEMANMVKCVLTLSHGQAGVERSFSLRTGLLEDNMKADSLNARRIVKDHMLSNGLKAETIVIENKLLLSVKGARMKYEAAKVEKRSSGAALTKDTLVQTLNGEITDVKSKIRNLKKVQEELDIEFEDFVFEAEKNPAKAALLVTKATAMKRKSNEVKEDIKKLEEAEQVLQEKRKKLTDEHWTAHSFIGLHYVYLLCCQILCQILCYQNNLIIVFNPPNSQRVHSVFVQLRENIWLFECKLRENIWLFECKLWETQGKCSEHLCLNPVLDNRKRLFKQ